jgi:hypothetical protein
MLLLNSKCHLILPVKIIKWDVNNIVANKVLFHLYPIPNPYNAFTQITV